MTAWEYRVLKVEIGRFTGPKVDVSTLEAALDTLGAEGWELVSTMDTNIAKGASDELVLFMKRPRPEG